MLKPLTLVFFALALVSCASAIVWRPCPGGSRTLNFDISGCDGKKMCTVKRGESRSLSMKFRANYDTSSLTAVVLGKSRGMSSPMPLASNVFDSNACNFLQDGASCPIVRDRVYSYSVPFFIENFFPPSTYLIQFSLKDSKTRTQSCGRAVIRVA